MHMQSQANQPRLREVLEQWTLASWGLSGQHKVQLTESEDRMVAARGRDMERFEPKGIKCQLCTMNTSWNSLYDTRL